MLYPRWNSMTKDPWNTSGPCMAGCQGQDTHTEDTHCCHQERLSQPLTRYVPHLFSSQSCMQINLQRRHMKTQHKDGLYINGSNIKLLMQSTWKQATLLFLMYVHIVTQSHDKLEFIHSFNKNVLGVSYVSGTVSDNVDTVVGGEKKIHALWGLLSGESKKDINKLYQTINATEKNKSVNRDRECPGGVGGYNFKQSHERRHP